MSMILDALRKSDRERARAAADRLREGPAVAAQGESKAWAAAIAAAVLLAMAMIILLFLLPRNGADRTATGTMPEIMENGASDARAAVRDLAGELLRIEPAPPEPVEADSPTRAEVVENLAAPPFEALPAAIRIKLPELHVNVHAWSENPRERFVLINLRRYQEGDRLQEGPLLHRILRNGVVLEFEGTLFTLSRQ